MDSFDVHHQLIQDSGKFGNTVVLFILFLDARQSPAEIGLRLYIIAPLKIEVSQFDLANGFIQSVLRTLLDSQFIVFDSLSRIFPAQIDIAQSIIYLVKVVFVLLAFRHALQHLDHFLGIGSGKDFRLPDTGCELQFIRRIGTDDFSKGLICQAIHLQRSIHLSQ